MTTTTTLKINETRREVARTIVKAIGDWLETPRPITVYIDKDVITDTYTATIPADHVADLHTVNEWAYGDRDDYDALLSDDEASALIDLFETFGQWLADTVEIEGQTALLIYADEAE